MQKDVFTLYAFVRKADDYIDTIPQDTKGFYMFKKSYYDALHGEKTGNIVIDSFVDLAREKDFDHTWTDAFLASMESDIHVSSYDTIDDLIDYMYGSAEVIGLYMASIMKLPTEAILPARYLGRAMQYVNFIRDIAEDITLQRTYMPMEELNRFDITSLEYDTVKSNASTFTEFIRTQLRYFTTWQKQAEKGFSYIPKRYLIPIKTASEMYKWTAKQIYKDPFIIYKRKIKPHIHQIITTLFASSINPKEYQLKKNGLYHDVASII